MMTSSIPDGGGAAPDLVFAGFWRRVGAFFIDCLALGCVGMGLGFLAFDALAALGGWGRLVGFAIATPYLGLMNSRLGGGRTLGKRLLGLRTVGVDGRLLSPARGLVRAALLGLPWFINGATVGPDALQVLPLAWGISLAIIGLGLGNLYLLVFNRPSRRGLHDWAAGSAVVREPLAAGADLAAPGWRGHRLVLGALVLAALALPPWLQGLMDAEDVAPMIAMRATVMAQPHVRQAGVTVGKAWASGAPGPRAQIAVQVFVDAPDVDFQALSLRVAQALIERHPEAAKVDQLAVVVVYGFDIGIGSIGRTRQEWLSPAKWRERFGGEASAAQ